LAVLAIAIAYIIGGIASFFNFSIPWWVDAPGPFDRFVWKIPVVAKIGLVKVPDLNGKWPGHIITSFDDQQDDALRHEVSVSISQSWTRISICLQTNISESRSTTASIVTQQPPNTILVYEYHNAPRALAPTTMHEHRGLCRLSVRNEAGATLLEGEYFSGRDRQNQGLISLRREAQEDG
jgi:hypothetical protein